MTNTAFNVYKAVTRAETAKDLISRLSKEFREEQETLDALAALQLAMFAAANWMRRFVDDRNANDLDYSFIQEHSEGAEMAEVLNAHVDKLFEHVTTRNQSSTVKKAFEAFAIQWRREDAELLKTSEVENGKAAKKLQRAYNKSQGKTNLSKKRQFQFRKAIAELEDARAPLTESQKELVDQVKKLLEENSEEVAVPKWRSDGIKTLGPFGIASNIDIQLKCEFEAEAEDNKKPTGTYIMLGPKMDQEDYAQGLGGEVKGMLSPLEEVTIKQHDPTAALIRIPPGAKFFAFAYPVITAELEVTRTRYSPTDAFLLYGGYVYFDAKMNVIAVNALWVGSNLQLSAPKKLPDDIKQTLLDAGRFRDITLPQLWEAGARKFCWMLPAEFPELKIPHGGWCYIYEDEEINNYFAIASAASVKGVYNVVFDIPEDSE